LKPSSITQAESKAFRKVAPIADGLESEGVMSTKELTAAVRERPTYLVKALRAILKPEAHAAFSTAWETLATHASR
ncbi:MAG: hypothetical protein V2I33_22955, partial [Kangiellaceae bacterium]|nr:hypothetical protein [Kangiellaceae bacterium]